MNQKRIFCPECGHRVNEHIYDGDGDYLPICDVGACDCTLTPEGIIVMLGLDLEPLLETLLRVKDLAREWHDNADRGLKTDHIGFDLFANDVESMLGDIWK